MPRILNARPDRPHDEDTDPLQLLDREVWDVPRRLSREDVWTQTGGRCLREFGPGSDLEDDR